MWVILTWFEFYSIWFSDNIALLILNLISPPKSHQIFFLTIWQFKKIVKIFKNHQIFLKTFGDFYKSSNIFKYRWQFLEIVDKFWYDKLILDLILTIFS